MSESWDTPYLKAFMEMGGLSAKVSDALQQGMSDKPMLRERFLAWLLYGYAHYQQGDEAHGIKNPAAYARSRVRQVAEPRYRLLAQTPPWQIALWLRNPYLTRPAELADLLKQLQTKGFLDVLESAAQRRAELTVEPVKGA